MLKFNTIFTQFFILLFLIQATNAQTDSILLKNLKNHQYSISIQNKNINGTGLDFLHKMASQAHYFLIGEQHGISETPLFTSSLLRDISSLGYTNYATEIGPITAKIMTKRTKEVDVERGIEGLLKRFPWAIPFFAWKDEVQVLEVLKKQTQFDDNFWGLDQEFIISARMLFQELITIAKEGEEKKVATEYYNSAINSFLKSIKTGKPLVFLSSAKIEDYNRLKDTFKNSEQGLRIIREMQESQEIYDKLMVQNLGYESNHQRANLFKKHFLEYYSTLKPTSEKNKVLIKLGANHVYKGLNPLGVLDIGNFINEFAVLKHQKSFHLYVLPTEGEQNAFSLMSRSEKDKKKPLNNSNNPTYRSVIRASEGKSSVFDLRPIRNLLFNKKLKNIDENLKRIIYGYDAILVLPKVTASINYD